ncbi:MAG: hypothetical protein GC182_10855 [Rhodopseudomonas sp.]|nr:hypothetical protein [Rhodopseudomonas sp.]
MSEDAKPMNPDQARALMQVRRFMMIALLTTVVAIGLVFAVIGYKIYRSGDSAEEAAAPPPDVTVSLPAGAKVLSTAIGNDHIVVTVETPAGVELRTFDPDTLQPLGRLHLTPKP